MQFPDFARTLHSPLHWNLRRETPTEEDHKNTDNHTLDVQYPGAATAHEFPYSNGNSAVHVRMVCQHSPPAELTDCAAPVLPVPLPPLPLTPRPVLPSLLVPAFAPCPALIAVPAITGGGGACAVAPGLSDPLTPPAVAPCGWVHILKPETPEPLVERAIYNQTVLRNSVQARCSCS